MNTILLKPTDVLFFRDGRPMDGASAGHGAAWPLPTVVNYAFHAALHRAGDIFEKAHRHRRGRSGIYEEERDRCFGSLVTAGPFPVCTDRAEHTWFFPRPADASDSGEVILLPHKASGPGSFALEGHYHVVSTRPPTKEKNPRRWWSEGAWNAYLGSPQRHEQCRRTTLSDAEFSDTEHNFGIAIDPETGSVEQGRFYSAHYLRLRDGWELGMFAAAPDEDFHHETHGNDLVRALLNGDGAQIVAGGQQRVCTATLEPATGRLPMPLGLTRADQFAAADNKYLVKWVLLSPAIWPEIQADPQESGPKINAHPGGWLPNWICPDIRDVLLEYVSREERLRRRQLRQNNQRYESKPGRMAKLVAAIVPKPIPVTGWALPNDIVGTKGGAKMTQLAVPGGAVYYFEANTAADAERLAALLNWHGSETHPTTIKNRRSTMMGEKGFGLGVCGTWKFHEPETKA
jgi:CRISPR-associated protein Cmr3